MSSLLSEQRSIVPQQVGAPRLALLARVLLLPALASALLASATALSATPDEGLDSILASLAQRRHGHALFSEQIDSALFKRPLITSGELFFDAPDRMEKKTLQPAQEDVLVEGDIVTIVRGTHHTSMRLGDYPQLGPVLNGIRATLAGDRPALEKDFRLAFTSSGSGWALTLQPLPTQSKPLYKHIRILGVGGTVQSVTLERVTGERTTMTLSEPADP
jgi:hypothetical protein